jgi:hypothetical protein
MGTGVNWLWAVIPRGPYPADWAAYYTTPDINWQSNSPHSELYYRARIAMFNPPATSKDSEEDISKNEQKILIYFEE